LRTRRSSSIRLRRADMATPCERVRELPLTVPPAARHATVMKQPGPLPRSGFVQRTVSRPKPATLPHSQAMFLWHHVGYAASTAAYPPINLPGLARERHQPALPLKCRTPRSPPWMRRSIACNQQGEQRRNQSSRQRQSKGLRTPTDSARPGRRTASHGAP
jgi:hypothetical protein